MNRFIALSLSLVSASFSVAASARSVRPVAEIEEVSGVTITRTINRMPVRPAPGHDRDDAATNEYTTVKFTAMSSGCTGEESFELRLRDITPVEQSLEILRVKPDTCRMTRHPVEIELTLEGVNPAAILRIANPLLVTRQVVY